MLSEIKFYLSDHQIFFIFSLFIYFIIIIFFYLFIFFDKQDLTKVLDRQAGLNKQCWLWSKGFATHSEVLHSNR